MQNEVTLMSYLRYFGYSDHFMVKDASSKDGNRSNMKRGNYDFTDG